MHRAYLQLELRFCLAVGLFLLFHVGYTQEKINPESLFKGVIKQGHDGSCGAAALANIINGMVDGASISELEVIQAIQQVVKHEISEEGYSILDLQLAAKKLGYQVEWRKVAPANLPKLKQPVLLVVGLNTPFPHYVVLKGIRDGEAFLADSVRGNVRINYTELIAEGINKQYPMWFAMGLRSSTSRPKDSALFLSDSASERRASHVTFAQSSVLTLTNLAQTNQVILDYGIGNSSRSKIATHTFGLKYGITNDTQVDINFYTDANNQNHQYGLAFKQRFSLDELKQNNLIFNLSGFYLEEGAIWGGEIGIIASNNNRVAQVFVGGSVSKELTHSTSNYTNSIFIGANKPLGDRYFSSITLTMPDTRDKALYAISNDWSYVLDRRWAISTSVGYVWGHQEEFTFNFGLSYSSGW